MKRVFDSLKGCLELVAPRTVLLGDAGKLCACVNPHRRQLIIELLLGGRYCFSEVLREARGVFAGSCLKLGTECLDALDYSVSIIFYVLYSRQVARRLGRTRPSTGRCHKIDVPLKLSGYVVDLVLILLGSVLEICGDVCLFAFVVRLHCVHSRLPISDAELVLSLFRQRERVPDLVRITDGVNGDPVLRGNSLCLCVGQITVRGSGERGAALIHHARERLVGGVEVRVVPGVLLEGSLAGDVGVLGSLPVVVALLGCLGVRGVNLGNSRQRYICWCGKTTCRRGGRSRWSRRCSSGRRCTGTPRSCYRWCYWLSWRQFRHLEPHRTVRISEKGVL